MKTISYFFIIFKLFITIPYARADSTANRQSIDQKSIRKQSPAPVVHVFESGEEAESKSFGKTKHGSKIYVLGVNSFKSFKIDKSVTVNLNRITKNVEGKIALLHIDF